ncbi:MAG: WD40/YVTN/BNR-like repeat-containing protein, partial [Gemmatimonadaceae bacterium]
FHTIGNGVHGDHQALWIDPLNPKRILSGSDGGWQVSYDGGKTFEVVNTFAFTQFYHINYDMQKPYMVCGGLQDNGNWCGPSLGLTGAIRKADWFTVSGGDGFFTVPDIAEPWMIYSDAQGGMINITDTRTGTQATIYPYPNRVGSVGDKMLNHKYRFNWNSPIALSPQNPGVVYFGGNVLFKSSNHGMSWTAISPDLSTNDPAKLGDSGGPIVVDNTAAEFHCTIITIAPSPLDSNVIWVGTDDGNVQVTRDGGKTWTNVIRNIQGLKPNAWIPTIDASHVDVGTAYVAADHHEDDDYSPYAYVTTDFGKTWRSVIGDLPAKAAWMHVIREDPRNRNLLYIGTEMGIWASWDRGTHWTSLRGDLPIVPVRDIQVQPRDNDLLVATHGRGLYILDDITALQQYSSVRGEEAVLFDIRPAIRWNMWNKDGSPGQKQWTGANPPEGALITYYLKTQPPHAVNVTIADKDGRTVRRMNRVLDDAGMNRIAWNLQYDPPAGGGGRGGRGGGGRGGRGGGGAPADSAAGGAAADSSLAAFRAQRRAAAEDQTPQQGGRGGGFGGGGAINVLPGTYTVTLIVEGKRYTKNVDVSLDPRSTMTSAQLATQYTAAERMQALAARVNVVINGVDDVTGQLTALQAALRSAPRDSASANTRQALSEISISLAQLKQFKDSVLARPLPGLGYRQYPRLREEVQTVSGMISRPMMPPTAGEVLRSGELNTEANQAQVRFDAIMQDHVAKINDLLKGTPHVLIAAPVRFVP